MPIRECIGQANILSAVEVEGLIVRIVPSTFKQAGWDPTFLELEGDRDSGNASADYAHRRLNGSALAYLSRVDKHRVLQSCSCTVVTDNTMVWYLSIFRIRREKGVHSHHTSGVEGQGEHGP